MASELEIRTRLAEQRQALEDVLQGPYLRVGFANASLQHHELFERYVRALTSAKAYADDWWQSLIDVATERMGDAREARTNVEMRRPGGRVVHGRVVHVFRGAWMGCVALNARLPAMPKVEPFELTMDWLVEHQQFTLAEFVGGFPFLPVAIDAAGDWV